jgi:hypothetical protein
MITISMAAIIAGKIVANAPLALVADSIDPPNSMRQPAGGDPISGQSAVSISLETSGGRVASLMGYDREASRSVLRVGFGRPDRAEPRGHPRSSVRSSTDASVPTAFRRLRADRRFANVLAALRHRDANEKELESPTDLRWLKADEVQSVLTRTKRSTGVRSPQSQFAWRTAKAAR